MITLDHIKLEDAMTLCDLWLEEGGFTEREDGWYDGNDFVGHDSVEAVYDLGFDGDVVQDLCDHPLVVAHQEEDDDNRKFEYIFSDSHVQKVAKEFGIPLHLLSQNLKTNGKTSREFLVSAYEGHADLQMAKETTRIMQFSARRHALTDYDTFDKSHMSEIEVERLRAEKNEDASMLS